MDNVRDQEGRFIAPPCSISAEGETVELRLEMPGVPKDGVEVRIEGNELSITGRRPETGGAGAWLMRERRPGSYRKVFTLDESIARDRVEAGLSDGVLTLTLHLREAAKPRRIEIS